jgi:2-amino-4-hydroxy-6-hydroxymethyldihydropteridine diphosphokinase
MIKKKVLDAQHTLIHTAHFPMRRDAKKGHRALLGIGGNMGDVLRRFEHLWCYLNRAKMLRIIQTAPILKNPPFGYTAQEDFYNSVLLIETDLTPKVLLRYLLRVERLFGRKRSFQDAPRTLDIDIIFYENVKMNTQELTLPHHGWMKRNSVLIPLSYIQGNKK